MATPIWWPFPNPTSSFDGPLYVSDITNSTKPEDGSIQTDGGLGVVKDTNIGGTLDVVGATTVFGDFSATNTTDSTSASTGSLVTSGGAGVTLNLHVGEDLHVAKKIRLTETAGTTDTVSISAPAGITTSYDITLPTTAGTSAYFLQTDGSGNTTWALPAIPVLAIDDLTDGDTTVFSSVLLGSATPGASETSVAVGVGCLESTISPAADNTALGYTALASLTSGINNTAVGSGTGFFATTGGSNALIGSGSGLGITTGSTNTCAGSSSGTKIIDGDNNTCIGANAETTNEFLEGVPAQYQTSIGAGAVCTADNQVTLGTSSETVQIPGNVAVTGTLTANNDLTVTGTLTANIPMTLGDIKTGLQAADHPGWVKLDGRLKSTLSAFYQTQATTLGFGTNLPDASNSVLIQNGGTLGAITSSNTKTITQSDLPNATLSGTSNSSGIHNHSGTATAVGDHNHGYDIYSPGPFGNTSGTDTGTIIGTKDTTNSGGHSHSVTTTDSSSHQHAFTTSSINGNVSQTSIDVTPQSMSVNKFVYLGFE